MLKVFGWMLLPHLVRSYLILWTCILNYSSKHLIQWTCILSTVLTRKFFSMSPKSSSFWFSKFSLKCNWLGCEWSGERGGVQRGGTSTFYTWGCHRCWIPSPSERQIIRFLRIFTQLLPISERMRKIWREQVNQFVSM